MMRHKKNPLTFIGRRGTGDCDADWADFVVLHRRTFVPGGCAVVRVDLVE